jgi:hypothetical protein
MAAALLNHHAGDVVITMGCGDACPLYPGKRYDDWELDPADHDVAAVRPIGDEIDRRVVGLMASLDINPPDRPEARRPPAGHRLQSALPATFRIRGEVIDRSP